MRVAIGRKRGILISILLHILLLTYLLYFIKTYYYSGLADSANRPAARVSMFSPSTKPASTQPDSAAPDIDTAQESPVSTAQPPDEPYEQPPTTLIMPQETTSPVVENIVPTQKNLEDYQHHHGTKLSKQHRLHQHYHKNLYEKKLLCCLK